MKKLLLLIILLLVTPALGYFEINEGVVNHYSDDGQRSWSMQPSASATTIDWIWPATAGVTGQTLYSDGTSTLAWGIGMPSSLTDGGILLGNGTGNITALRVATNGEIPIGDGDKDPVLAVITATSPVVVTNGAGTIALSHAATAGNIHLPTGGSANQILKNSGVSGTGSWGTVTENSGALAAITTIGMSGQLTSTLATGTAPLVVASTTLVSNLNADLWDGYQFADYLDQAVKIASSPTFAGVTITGTLGAGLATLTDTTQQLKLVHTAGVDYADFIVNSDGDLSITCSGGDVSLGDDNLGTTGNLTVGTTGNLTVGTNVFTVNSTNKRVGFLKASPSPTYPIHIWYANSTDPLLMLMNYQYSGSSGIQGLNLTSTNTNSGTASQKLEGVVCASKLYKTGNAVGALQQIIGGVFQAGDWSGRTYSATGTYDFRGGWFYAYDFGGNWSNNPTVNSYDAYIGWSPMPTFGTNHTHWGIYAPVTGSINAIAGKLRLGSTVAPVNALDVTGAAVIGDGGTTNYTQISSTGAITQAGTAKATLQGLGLTHIDKTADYTILDADTYNMLICNHATVAIAITLPTAAANANKIFWIKNIGAAIVTVAGEGAETIDDSATQTVNQYECLAIYCDGTEWWAI